LGELTAERLAEIIWNGKSHRREGDGGAARFAEGDTVRTTNNHPGGHTRLPRYAMGRTGTIVKNHGIFGFPDTNARGEGEQPQHCYAVCFEGTELWGSAAHARDAVVLDLFDSYLEAP
tara:strand:- start:1413 stop:1766 length:354 start_codon:yes stop_codon:yes gene_type:complete